MSDKTKKVTMIGLNRCIYAVEISFFELQASFFIPLWFASPLFYEEDKSICISIEKRIENHLQSIKEGLDLLEEGTEKHKGS